MTTVQCPVDNCTLTQSLPLLICYHMLLMCSASICLPQIYQSHMKSGPCPPVPQTCVAPMAPLPVFFPSQGHTLKGHCSALSCSSFLCLMQFRAPGAQGHFRPLIASFFPQIPSTLCNAQFGLLWEIPSNESASPVAGRA